MMRSKIRLSLYNLQVPEPNFADEVFYGDMMRWLLMVMDTDDPGMPFIASCFCQFLKSDRLTEKQEDAVTRIFSRVEDSYCYGQLQCQVTTEADGAKPFAIEQYNGLLN